MMPAMLPVRSGDLDRIRYHDGGGDIPFDGEKLPRHRYYAPPIPAPVRVCPGCVCARLRHTSWGCLCGCPVPLHAITPARRTT